MDTIDQVIIKSERKSEGRMRVMSMLAGMPIMTYPTKRIETAVWNCVSSRLRSLVKVEILARAMALRSRSR
jgi:hypothetical protein